jgi:hypothetical protein
MDGPLDELRNSVAEDGNIGAASLIPRTSSDGEIPQTRRRPHGRIPSFPASSFSPYIAILRYQTKKPRQHDTNGLQQYGDVDFRIQPNQLGSMSRPLC